MYVCMYIYIYVHIYTYLHLLSPKSLQYIQAAAALDGTAAAECEEGFVEFSFSREVLVG